MTGSQNDGELSITLLDMLVCPIDHQTLAYVPSESVLYNPRLKKSFDIKESIPIVLVEETTDVDDATHEKYLNAATRYTGPRDTHLL